MAGDLGDDFELQHSDDEGQEPAAHSKLLGAVSQLYEKKRVKAPTRKEPSLEVSEFHLSQPDKKKGRVKVTELAKVLNKRAVHAEIGHKLKIARKRAKTLPKPLEKFHADQITRAAGYEHARRQLNRWDAVVYQHKVAEQLTFPLKSETVRIHQETTDVSKLFRKPTDLEIKLAEMLKEPDPTKPHKEEESKNEEREEEYPLTLAEVVEKRKIMAKLRAQQSYKQSKAARHSKIKSKKFHQIQRRARVKEQLREFEELQKRDPEAALRKLEELERTRAEERVTLRHRSTGQWAKNLAVRAKYDKEARIALSEQLAQSRELTVKLAQGKDSESEKEEEEEEKELDLEEREEDPNNPWVVKPTKEVADFISGYRKYWESKEQHKKAGDESKTAVKVADSSNELRQNVDKDISIIEISKDNPNSSGENEKESKIVEEELSSSNSIVNTVAGKNISVCRKSLKGNERSRQIEKICDSISECESDNLNVDDLTDSVKRKSIGNSLFSISSSNLNKENIMNNSLGKSDTSFSNKANVSIGHDIGKFEVSSCKQKVKKRKNNEINSSFTISSTPVSKNNIQHTKTPETNRKSGVWSVTKISGSVNNQREKVVNQKIVAKSPTGKFFVSESANENGPDTNKTEKTKTIDDLFEEVEDKLQDKIREKCEKLRESFASKRKNEEDSGVESDTEEVPSLEMKKRRITAEVDDELMEQPSSTVGSKVNEKVDRTLATATSVQTKQSDDIDPNKFMKVTPRHLVSKLPDIATEGEDAMDDEGKTAEDRHLTISEAFAEDDVVDQFHKEKEEEAKKNSIADVDLTLPGWGSWGGHNIKTNRRNRKKFVIKFPKLLPRRDTNRGNVIINEDADKPILEHQVSDVPYPFTSVKEYEASIRAPLGATWVPRTACVKLTAPALVTPLGAVIAPMDDTQLVKKDKSQVLSSKKAKKKSMANKI